MTQSQLTPTLSGREYVSDDVFAREREHIFHKSWFYVCRDDRLASGDRFVADFAGERLQVWHGSCSQTSRQTHSRSSTRSLSEWTQLRCSIICISRNCVLLSPATDPLLVRAIDSF